MRNIIETQERLIAVCREVNQHIENYECVPMALLEQGAALQADLVTLKLIGAWPNSNA